jgi:hypothetical protein
MYSGVRARDSPERGALRKPPAFLNPGLLSDGVPARNGRRAGPRADWSSRGDVRSPVNPPSGLSLSGPLTLRGPKHAAFLLFPREVEPMWARGETEPGSTHVTASADSHRPFPGAGITDHARGRATLGHYGGSDRTLPVGEFRSCYTQRSRGSTEGAHNKRQDADLSSPLSIAAWTPRRLTCTLPHGEGVWL